MRNPSFKTLALSAALTLSALSAQADTPEIKVFKSPWCGCCTAWSQHMRDNGFSVTEIKRKDMDAIKRTLGVPERLESCHTAMIDGYIIEGHVPASDVKRLLNEKPNHAKGLSVPGMPIGSPGMEQGNEKERYTTVLFGPDRLSAFERH